MNREKVLAEYILECLGLILVYSRGVTEEEFCRNTAVQDRVIRRLEVMGDAVNRLPAEFKAQYPEIPWKKISAMRDILAHNYFGVDAELTWKLVANKIPHIQKSIVTIIKKLS